MLPIAKVCVCVCVCLYWIRWDDKNYQQKHEKKTLQIFVTRANASKFNCQLLDIANTFFFFAACS